MKLLLPTVFALTARLSSRTAVKAFSSYQVSSYHHQSSSNVGISTTSVPNSRLHLLSNHQRNSRFFSSTAIMAKKAGVADLEELKEVVEQAGDQLVVVDVRNPDASMEPGDQKSLAVAGLPTPDSRPQAKHFIWSRTDNKLVLSEEDQQYLNNLPKDTPIITHCGGGGRGQTAKEYLVEQYGFDNVHNGGGPKEQELWKVYGDK